MKIQDIDSWDRETCLNWLALYDWDIPKRSSSIEKIRELVKEIIEYEIPYLLDDSIFTEEACKIRDAVKLLMQITNDELVLLADENASVYILPAVLKDGMVEYGVSNGILDRSTSYDFFDLKEAIKEHNRICVEGWNFPD